MRKSKLIIVLLMLGAGNACDKSYLDRQPLGLEESAIANKNGVENLLIGAYSMLDGIGSPKSGFGSSGSNWIYGSVCGTEAYKGSDATDQDLMIPIEKFSVIADNSLIESRWATVFDGIQRANDVLRIMPKAKDVLPADQRRIAGEAHFLRGHYHFEAKKMWNNVPFIDESITYGNGNYLVSNDKDIWPDIENDLQFAVDSLNEEPHNGAVGRATKFTAKALLAKVYMFQKKFAAAKPLLEDIINSGPFQLNSYHENFNPETRNSKESIFSVQMSVNDHSEGLNGNYGDLLNFPSGGPAGCCGFFKPSQYLVNHFKTLANGLPDLDHFNEGDDVTSDEGIESGDPSFTPYEGRLDPRLDWTVGRRGIPYLDWGIHPGRDWAHSQDYSGPFNPKKNVFYVRQVGALTESGSWAHTIAVNNINLIRFADVILWAAEVEAEIGSLDQSEAYVNMIRERAADPDNWVHTYVDPNDPTKGFTNIPAAQYVINPYPLGDFATGGKDYALKAIRFERMLELGMEGHRFFDLVRWGIAGQEINAYFLKEKIKRLYLGDAVFTPGCNEYFPIPQREVDLSSNLKQNRCY